MTIGKYCSIAGGVTLHCGGAHRTSTVSTWPFDCLMLGRANLDSRTYKQQPRTIIGHDVWVAHGATIMAGITIGNGAVIGPQAVAFEDVEPYAVVRGNPAKCVRFRHCGVIREALQRIAWWDWPRETIRERIEDFYGDAGLFVEKYG